VPSGAPKGRNARHAAAARYGTGDRLRSPREGTYDGRRRDARTPSGGVIYPAASTASRS
jgi:hypothetical protein